MERNHCQKASCRIHHYVIDEGVRTGKLQDFRKITHTHKKCGISMFVQKDSLESVKVTDSHKAVIGHHGQEYIVHASKHNEKKNDWLRQPAYVITLL